MRTVSILDRNLSSTDACTPDGIVHYGRLFDIAGDAETEVLILNDGDESLALAYNDVEILEEPITVMAMIAEYEVPEERVPAL